MGWTKLPLATSAPASAVFSVSIASGGGLEAAWLAHASESGLSDHEANDLLADARRRLERRKGRGKRREKKAKMDKHKRIKKEWKEAHIALLKNKRRLDGK